MKNILRKDLFAKFVPYPKVDLICRNFIVRSEKMLLNENLIPLLEFPVTNSNIFRLRQQTKYLHHFSSISPTVTLTGHSMIFGKL